MIYSIYENSTTTMSDVLIRSDESFIINNLGKHNDAKNISLNYVILHYSTRNSLSSCSGGTD